MSENTKGLENLVELRSLALLDDLVKARGRKGAAEALGVDRRTLAASVDSGKLTNQMREAVDRLLFAGRRGGRCQGREEVQGVGAPAEGARRGTPGR